MNSNENFTIYDMDKTRIEQNHLYSVDKYYGFIRGLSFEQAVSMRKMMQSKLLRYSKGNIIPSAYRKFINNICGYEVEKSVSKIANHFTLDGTTLKIRRLSPMHQSEIDEILYCAENIMNHPVMIGEQLESHFRLPLKPSVGNETFVTAKWVSSNGRVGTFEISYGQMLPVKNSKVYSLGDFMNSRPY